MGTRRRRPRADPAKTSASKPRPVDKEGNTENDGLVINRTFAAKYEEQKRKELLRSLPSETLHALESSQSSESSSESEEEEDEFGELLTKKIDRRIKETLTAIHNKDPRIYDPNTRFFKGDTNDSPEGNNSDDSAEDGNDGNSGADNSDDEPVAGWDAIANAAQKNTPKFTIKDYVRETLLENGALSESDNDEDGRAAAASRKKSPGRANIAGASGSTIMDRDEKQPAPGTNAAGVEAEKEYSEQCESGEEEEDFFTKKEKTQEELEQEEKDFEKFSQRLSRAKSEKAGEELLLHSYLERETPDEKERFLRDFVLSNGWLDKNNGDAPGPDDYKIEIDRVAADAGSDESEDDLDRDEDFVKKAEEFEAKYNFRFEEPDGVQVNFHARRIEDSLRRPDERRKRARETRKKRKDKEKLLKAEEIKHLKNLKKKEVQSRLIALQEAAGSGVDFSGIDLDADFDPEEFSKQMDKKFGEDYYKQEDKDLAGRQDVAIVSEHRPNVSDVLQDNDVNADEPGLHTAVERLMDEYYQLDYEDIVDGVPVRFNYKQVEREDFGMTAEEVLNLEEKELNRRASLKYLAPYRSNRDVRTLAKKAKWRASRKPRGSAGVESTDNAQSGWPSSVSNTTELNRNYKRDLERHQGENANVSSGKDRRRKRKRGRHGNDADAAANGQGETQRPHSTQGILGGQKGSADAFAADTEPTRKQDKRLKRKQDVLSRLSEQRLAAYSIN